MNERVLFCIFGIVALGFCIFSDIDIIRLRMQHKLFGIIRIIFCIAGILLLTVILLGNLR